MTCSCCNANLAGQYYVDGRIVLPGTMWSIWAYACLDCWKQRGVGKFMLGGGRLYNPKHEPIPHKIANDSTFQQSIGL